MAKQQGSSPAAANRKSKSDGRLGTAEILLRWFGGVSTRAVSLVLGVARPTAQTIVNTLIGGYESCVTYDGSQREHVPAESRCSMGRHDGIAIDAGDARGLLRMLSGAKAVTDYLGVPDPWEFAVIEDATARISPLINGDVLSIVLTCMRLRQACSVQYASRSRNSQRVVSPHAIFHASGRYYFRAWCHGTMEYRNFALARCSGAYRTEEDYVSGLSDREWKKRVSLRFRLKTDDLAESDALRQEWDLSDDILTIPDVREACVPFIKRRFLAPNNAGKKVWEEV